MSSPASKAQSGTPVIQAVPPAGAERLNAALKRLAQRPNDRLALLDAGKASLDVGDIAAARGFFVRAMQQRPNDPAAKLGLAAVAVRSEDPFTALRLFDEVQLAGQSSAQYAADQGLAYDLVGDTSQAQIFYREAMLTKRTPELTRRMALSQAIGGDLRSAEATLLPLLQKQDLAAYRTRAFVLAIAGKREDAMAIAEAVMPTDMARRLEPYLGYMPRLTAAQQAAAGNFGHFPLASRIGQDDPRVLAYAESNGLAPRTQVASRGATRLIPSGRALGNAASTASSSVPVSTPAARPASVAELPPVGQSVGQTTSQQSAPTQLARAELPASRPQPITANEARASASAASERAARSIEEVVATNLRSLPPPTRADLVRGASERAVETAAMPASTSQPASAATELASNITAIDEAVALAEEQVAIAAENAAPTVTELAATELAATSSDATADIGPSIDLSAGAPSSTAAPSEPVLVARMETSASAAPAPTNTSPTSAPSASATPLAPPPSGPEAVEVPASKPSSASTAIATVDEPAQVIPRSATIERLPTGSGTPSVAAASSSTTTAAPDPAPSSVAEAFAGFALNTSAAEPVAGAVDIRTIEIRREEEAEPAPEPAATAEPAKPENPSRFWVQVATGKDTSALYFDFRRISRKAPDLFKGRKGFTAEWGQSNRLITGPFDSAKAARDFVNSLKAEEIDSFTFTSADGQEIAPLKR